VETWEVSRDPSALDGYGRSKYIEEVINEQSDYIYVVDNTEIASSVYPGAIGASALTFASGAIGTSPSAADYVTGWEQFDNRSDVSVNILIGGGITETTVIQKMFTLASTRQDCFAFCDTPYGYEYDEAVTWRDAISLSAPSFGAFFHPWMSRLDTYTGRTIDVPMSGLAAGKAVYVDNTRNIWTSFAGTDDRGTIDVIEPLESLTTGAQEHLFTNSINPVFFIPGRGVCIMGEKTAQKTASALDSIPVRRLVNQLLTDVADTLTAFLGLPNTSTLRQQISGVVEQYVRPIEKDGGLYAYQVVCNDTNNTSTLIDQGILAVDLYIQPVRAVRFIKYQIVITRTGVSFQEVAA